MFRFSSIFTSPYVKPNRQPFGIVSRRETKALSRDIFLVIRAKNEFFILYCLRFALSLQT